MPYIAFPNGVKTQEDVNYFFSRNNISPKVIGRLDDILLIKQITENGFCFCVVPEHVVEHNFNSTKLVRLGEVPNLSFDLWGIFPRISADRVLVKTIIRDYFDL